MSLNLKNAYDLRLALAVVFAAYLAPQAMAQESHWTVGDSIQLARVDGVSFVQPRWSPLGDRLAFTGPSYKGLWVTPLDDVAVRQVTDERAAGFGFSWSGDGSALLARVARYDGIHRYNAVKVFDIETFTNQQLTEYRTSMSSLPRWTADDRAVLYDNDRLEKLGTGGVGSENKQTSGTPVYFPAGNGVGRVDPSTGGVTSIVSGEAGDVLNLVVSPDGSQVAYELLGGNLIVLGTDGKGRINLGPGHRPRWSPDSQWIVFEITEDDGHDFTASDLFVARSNGSGRQRLTQTTDAMEMNPDWSPDGQFIAYDDDGVIRLLPISQK